MRKCLPEKWIIFLRTMPESGQGFQMAEIHLKDGNILQTIIYDYAYTDANINFDDIIKINVPNSVDCFQKRHKYI